MSIKSALGIFFIVFCIHDFNQILAEESVDSIRKGKFLGVTGYLSGSTDGFRVFPFWKQFNAILQVNVEKNKHKHGVFVLPASPLYYPPYAPYAQYNPYGLILPQHYGALGAGHHQMPVLFDEYKPQTTTLAPLNSDVDDKARLDFPEVDNNLNRLPNPYEQKVSVLNLLVRDDRQTHKRDIVHRNHTEEEVVATVHEITDINSIETTTDTSQNETSTHSTSNPSSSTTPTEAASSTDTSETVTQPSTSKPEIATAPSSIIDTGFYPLVNYYYGGTPNENASLIYFTTNNPTEDLSPPTEEPAVAKDRSDSNNFKPSIQYEYQNYRIRTDPHFVPIVGTQQIF